MNDLTILIINYNYRQDKHAYTHTNKTYVTILCKSNAKLSYYAYLKYNFDLKYCQTYLGTKSNHVF